MILSLSSRPTFQCLFFMIFTMVRTLLSIIDFFSFWAVNLFLECKIEEKLADALGHGLFDADALTKKHTESESGSDVLRQP